VTILKKNYKKSDVVIMLNM